ncbi:MAG: sensor histidine kinase [Faecalibacterium sp.]
MQNAVLVQIAMELWGAVICLIFASIIFFVQEKTSHQERLLLALLLQIFLLLLSDTLAWAYRGKAGETAYWAVRISNYLVFALNYFIGYTILLYLEELVRQHGAALLPGLKRATGVVCLLGLVVVTISQFTGYLYTFNAQNQYQRMGGYPTICIIAGIMQILIAVGILSCRKVLRPVQHAPLVLIFVLTFLAYLVQTVYYGVSLVNLSLTVGVVILFFGYEKERMLSSAEKEKLLLKKNLQLAQQGAELLRKDAQMAKINAKLTEKRTQIMLSQIQPHFLYNTLSTISFLCIKDPMKAKEVTDNFAEYLRTNLNSLQNDHLVPFAQELEHTRVYLAIEQVRFGEDLAVEYDIQCSDFLLPSLSIQPLVENAVRHGICGKEDGGKVTIRSRRADGKIRITVADDGVGFDPDALPKDGRLHLGLENVKQRLELLCAGEIKVDSAPEHGTIVTITLPEQQE